MNLRSQWILNTVAGLGAIVLILFFASFALGQEPFTILKTTGHFLLYLLGFVGFQLILPATTGFFIYKHAIKGLDRFFDEDSGMPNWLSVIVAVAIGLIIGYVWLKVTPFIALLPTFSVWPAWEFLRWLPAPVERINYGLLAWASITGILGALAGWME